MSVTKKIENLSFDDFLPMAKFLQDNEDKLKLLLSGEQKSALLYPIKGKRATKTIFFSEKLQFLINEFCIENELKIGDFVELAVIQYLTQNGFAERLNPILNTAVMSSADEGK